MSKSFLKQALGWGMLLWIIGYALGMILFSFVPLNLIGWIITPIGITLTLWVAYKKVSGNTISYYAAVGLVWALLAIICDYFFLVLAFHPADGYYKLDVYLYYSIMLVLPIMVGWYKLKKGSGK